ncbi:MAG: hypothetical protein HKK67_06450 [Chlorobiaceae bacterium]|nr:hypothetical protein [Chlorobiaceae bacterium]
MLITTILLILLTFFAMLFMVRYRKHRKKGVERRGRETWAIGIYKGPSPTKLSPPTDITNPILSANDVTDTKARFVADPFMIQNSSGYFLFFEVLNDKRDMGEIGYACSNNGVQWEYCRIIIKERFHLSYPYVFLHEGDYYMIPECMGSGGIQLYQAMNFPEGWKHTKTLVRRKGGVAPFVDPSIIHYKSRWYLFSYDGKSKNLHLFSAATLTGQWNEHPKSPVICNSPHYARPAGRVIINDDNIYRYAQDEVPNYGTKVWAFRILELTEENYREEPASEEAVLQPGKEWWNRDGMHTVDAHETRAGEWMAMVDGFTIKPISQ